MNPRKIEYKDGDTWRQVKIKLSVSRVGNYTFQHQGRRYVFKNLLEGCEVVVLEGNCWRKAGRVDKYGTIMLGLGETYSEMVERQNKGKTEQQIISEIQSFLHPAECPALDKTQRTLDSLKNVPREVIL